MYLDYLRTGDASQMARVVYHNAVDVLTLVSLAVEVLKRHQRRALSALSGPEALAVARWHQTAGRSDPAEAAFQVALADTKPDLRREALRRYTSQLKRQGRREQAVVGWREWHALAPEDPAPCIELAKHYEWHAKDLQEARRWALAALVCLTHRPADWRRDRAWAEVKHRLDRLARRLGEA
jgi:hypothetical protein